MSRGLLGDALDALDVRNLTLCVHDASFPSDADEDIGRGSPCSRGGRRFLEFVRALGFTGLQLGPDGETPADDPSPYRSSAFPRNVLSIALAPLAEDPEWDGLLPIELLERAVAERPAGAREHAAHAYARRVHARALEAAFRLLAPALLAEERRRFVDENASWLERYELFDVLQHVYGTGDVRRWNDAAARAAGRDAMRARHADRIACYRFVQFVADRQRRRLVATADGLGLRLFGDLPIGLSIEDEWCHPDLFLADYRMGAPPSRTNPDGQPWGYPVLDPDQYREDGRPGAALRFLVARMERLLATVHGVRIDHPHGLVCPWVYDARTDDVARGSRLFESPDRPGLASFAIVRPDQLNGDPHTPRHADGWVRDLSAAQVASYGILLEAVVGVVRRRGGSAADVACEVLSTLPLPLARVLDGLGLGRFRVTQKAVLSDPADVYRTENARPEDWVMVSTHDTPPIWEVVERWRRADELRDRAEYLSSRLASRADERETLARAFAADTALLVHAQFADLFASPARNVMVFFPDLFGLSESYNVPGTVGPENWSLRVPPDWAETHRQRLRDGRALDLSLALALALRARDGDRDLVRALEAAAGAYRHAARPVAVSSS